MHCHSGRHFGRVMGPILVACCLGCASGTHDGRRRESNEPAQLIATSAQAESGYSTEIRKIDGRQKSGGGHMIFPGRHSVEAIGRYDGHDNKGRAVGAMFGVVGAVVAYSLERENAAESSPLTACFIARPGHTYEVRTFAEGGVWHIEVFDHSTTYDVKSPCRSAPKPVDIYDTNPPLR